MRRTANRTALALTGLFLTALAAAILLAAAGVPLPWPRSSWLPVGAGSPAPVPSAPGPLLLQRTREHPLSLTAAVGAAFCLALLVAQAVPGTPARLRLHACDLATGALTGAVRTRAVQVTGVTAARARVSRGRRPRLELIARLSEGTAPADAADPLLAVLAEAADSTGLHLGLRLRLVPSRPRRRHVLR
ncbi:hypothetical protein ACFV6F_01660 [Kitasatospora phosalacinea]|uniref:hypothetical protein n=1 Tax=Kitasatospora phosalacinea TaxID=2065 RepID=UPI00365CC58C